MEYKLYHGNSTYLSLEDAHSFILSVKSTTPNLEVIILQAESAPAMSIVDTVFSVNLFTNNRLIFIKRLYRNKSKDTFLDKMLEQVKENTSNDVLVFWEDQKIKSNTKYYKFFKKDDLILERDKLNKRTFYTWLKEELSRYNLSADASVQRMLAEDTKYDPERCHQSIQKFLLTGEKDITMENLSNIVANTLEEDIWNLIDAINSSKKSNIIDILDKLKRQGVDANYIISMLARNIRLITLTKLLYNSGANVKEIASAIKIPPFTVPSLINTSKSYDKDKIKQLYTKLSNLDYQIKVGLIDGYLGLTMVCPLL